MGHNLKMAKIGLSDAYSMAQGRAQKSGGMPGSPVLDIRESLLAAIAAAAIAQAEYLAHIAEQRPQFVQVGKYHFNRNAIDSIEEVCSTTIIVYTGQVGAAELHGRDKAAFLLWHEQNADVVRLNAEPERIYSLTEDDVMDLAHHAVDLFLCNRTEHELDDDDNWNDVMMGLFKELDSAMSERTGPDWGASNV